MNKTTQPEFLALEGFTIYLRSRKMTRLHQRGEALPTLLWPLQGEFWAIASAQGSAPYRRLHLSCAITAPKMGIHWLAWGPALG